VSEPLAANLMTTMLALEASAGGADDAQAMIIAELLMDSVAGTAGMPARTLALCREASRLGQAAKLGEQCPCNGIPGEHTWRLHAKQRL
jgi:hypothetical protein